MISFSLLLRVPEPGVRKGNSTRPWCTAWRGELELRSITGQTCPVSSPWLQLAHTAESHRTQRQRTPFAHPPGIVSVDSCQDTAPCQSKNQQQRPETPCSTPTWGWAQHLCPLDREENHLPQVTLELASVGEEQAWLCTILEQTLSRITCLPEQTSRTITRTQSDATR